MRVFLTGDFHGQFYGLKEFCKDNKTTIDDLLICLGDVALNYNLDEHDDQRKKFLTKQPITFLCIRGNHEERPQYVDGMRFEWCPHIKQKCWHQDEYPNIWYINCDTFSLGDKKCLAISGAYSVDKEYRLMMGYNWFKDEQPTENEKKYVRKLIKENNGKFDYIFSHTCPREVEPTHLFLSGLDQSKIDKSTENFLQEVLNTTQFDYWGCGHFHSDEYLGKNVHMFYNCYKEIKI